MKRLTQLAALTGLLFLAACSGVATGMFATPSGGPVKSVDVTQLPSMRVVGLVVTVPETLRVSEINSYKPVADIVWRGDPFGDRYQQVATIFEDAIARGVAPLQGDLPVVVHIQVTRFHAVTERTRYSIGGVHEINFLLTVTNGKTGETVVPTYLVKSSLPAFGGEAALEAERAGLTQKVRISNFLAELIERELTGAQAPVDG